MFIRNDAVDTASTARWRGVEKTILSLVMLFAVSLILFDGVSLSLRVKDKEKIAGLGTSPWSETIKADVNDGQLRAFRSNLPLLILGAIAFVTARRFWTSVKTHKSQLQFYTVSGLLICTYLHGLGILYLVAWVLANYWVAKVSVGRRFFTLCAWLVNLSFLVLTEYFDGYGFKWIGLDNVERLYHPEMQWHRSSNLCFLKLMSFLLDWHWSRRGIPSPTKEKHTLKCTECSATVDCIRLRQETHADDYSLLAFFSYFFYFPLYLAGPTLSYNAWISQVQKPQQTYDMRRKLTYVVRLIVAWVLLELAVHFLYFPTISNNVRNKAIWEDFNAYELAIASYLVLKWIWLKFLVIWRFFRIWAICDGIESPENMGRCMSNNYCFEGFWRMWHRAFNQWLIRYLFVPLGGSKYKIYNIWIVFGFVAIWHDLRLHLLVWGWGMCLFIVPEVLAKAYFSRSRFSELRKTAEYNWMCAVAGGAYIILMMVANLVGFSFGLRGLTTIWEEIVHGDGVALLLKTWVLATVATHLMFAIRKDEEKDGKSKGY